MLNKQDFVFAPDTVTVRLSLEPAYNILNSLVLMNFPEERTGLPEWIVNTARSMSEEEARVNYLMFSAFELLEPTRHHGNFDNYLDTLDHLEPQTLVHRYLVMLSQYLPDEFSIDEILQSEAHFLHVIQKMYENTSEKYVEANYQMLYGLLIEPEKLKSTLIGHIHYMWEKYLRVEWARNLPIMNESIKAFKAIDLTHLTALEAIRAVTGRDMSSLWTIDEFRTTIVFVPSVHIGPYLTRLDDEDTSYVVFGARTPDGTPTNSSALSRAELLNQLNALADETRLMILELLTHHNELCAQDIMNILKLSQSSASRHLRQLCASGYIIERRRDVAKCYSLNHGRIKETSIALNIYLDKL